MALEDIQEKLGQILADPEALGNIMSMVQGLIPPTETPSSPAEEPVGGLDVSSIPLPLIAALSSSMTGDSKHTALFQALRPFLKPERQEKLDKALKMAQLSKVATAALKHFDLGTDKG